jgi:hypothetical protein
MARKISAKTVLNRKALTTIRAAFVDGMEQVGKDLISRTDPLDDPETREQIVGDWGIWVDGKKVAGTATKPRSARVKSGITLLAGFPFPMRFGEMGTIHQPARPRFSPTLNEVIPGTDRYMKAAVNRKGIR